MISQHTKGLPEVARLESPHLCSHITTHTWFCFLPRQTQPHNPWEDEDPTDRKKQLALSFFSCFRAWPTKTALQKTPREHFGEKTNLCCSVLRLYTGQPGEASTWRGRSAPALHGASMPQHWNPQQPFYHIFSGANIKLSVAGKEYS